MKISRITTQKKSKSRYNIFVDEGEGEKYGFSVDEDILIKFGLRKNEELDEAAMEKILQKDTLHKIYTQAINFLSYRMRTKKEIRDFLVKKEAEPEVIEEIMERLTSEKLINDEQFAEMFVRTRMNTSSKGPNVIKSELIEKGVAANIATESVAVFSYELQYEKALNLLEKKSKHKKNVSFRKQQEQWRTQLMQKGFSHDVINEVLNEDVIEKDEEAEQEALKTQADKLIRKYEKKYSDFELKNKVKEGLYRKGFPLETIQQVLDERIDV
ncbi:recombination regulator RecX [Oceanobacillus manasiensis]|uniref:recombination regulator RecX n=1 Tax=Oceanobacillus manasiensis TaxID=586413 RepID=UPI000AC36993